MTVNCVTDDEAEIQGAPYYLLLLEEQEQPTRNNSGKQFWGQKKKERNHQICTRAKVMVSNFQQEKGNKNDV